MKMERNCCDCRFFGSSGNKTHCNNCGTSTLDYIPSEWVPATTAQIFKRAADNLIRTNSGLSGSMENGYTYNPKTNGDLEALKDCINEKYGILSKEERKEYNKMYKQRTSKQKALDSIKNVIFNDPATIVFWADGTKTVVKCGDGDVFDPEKGLAMAIAKRAFDNQGYYYDVIKKWLPEEEFIGVSGEERLGDSLADMLEAKLRAAFAPKVRGKDE